MKSLIALLLLAGSAHAGSVTITVEGPAKVIIQRDTPASGYMLPHRSAYAQQLELDVWRKHFLKRDQCQYRGGRFVNNTCETQ